MGSELVNTAVRPFHSHIRAHPQSTPSTSTQTHTKVIVHEKWVKNRQCPRKANDGKLVSLKERTDWLFVSALVGILQLFVSILFLNIVGRFLKSVTSCFCFRQERI